MVVTPPCRRWKRLLPKVLTLLCLLAAGNCAAAALPRHYGIHGAPRHHGMRHERRPSRSMTEEELETICTESPEMPPVTKFPLDYSSLGVPPKDLILTQETSHNGDDESLYKPHWPEIVPWLPEHVQDVLQSWDLQSCALVGNSGNLLHTQYGDDIDKHGSVFRMNRAQALRYEPHVGSKTTVRLLNRYHSDLYASNGTIAERWKMMPAWESIPMEPNVTLLMSRIHSKELLTDMQNLTYLKQASQRDDVKAAILSHRVIMDAYEVLQMYRKCEKLNQPDMWLRDHISPSSGLVLLLWTMQMCDHVTVYGMGYPPRSKDTPYQYYFGRKMGNPIHDFSTETRILWSLADAGLITLCSPYDACSGKQFPFESNTLFSRSEALHEPDEDTREWTQTITDQRSMLGYEAAHAITSDYGL